ncbi:hypothetical protein [Flavobacterium sp. JAS]|uniref:hypothetical protein n=1 Tax=Flavobacterium sp. JAS TaxID=2897329 RepID=UPI001E39FF15|nr:hypothetical protein [Flavobacterium sp. JAS]MCD0471487.1 hypothetical protein [Flavobacterium sp. JAS]
MKTKLLLIAIIALGFASCTAQSQTTVYAKNSDISDNLDLRAVASMFGESANLQDFERRLNDPKYQISNLDLNDDNQVDYLRVIESVENRTHVVIIQAVLDRDVYQDVATIDVERDNYNRVNVQVVGNTYLYGDNYIYEPVYSVAPVIYSSFWVTNYRPYYSTWGWNVYPTYYAAWRPYPIYRYRNNIDICINVNNRYNYVNTRRSYVAPVLYQSRRTYGYETRRPDYGFSQRHSNVTNRYDLDQRRVASRDYNRNQSSYDTNRSNTGRATSTDYRTSTGRTSNSTDYRTPNRTYTDNRTNSDRSYNTNRVSTPSRDNTATVSNPVRVDNSSNRRDYSQNNGSYSRGNSQSTMNTNRVSTPTPQRTESPRSYSENRGYSENRASSARPQSSQNTQRSEAPRASQESRGGQPQRESGSNSRGNGGRRG